MIYSKEIVREWLDEVAERAKDHPDWGYSCYVASGFDSPTQTLPACG